MHTHTHMCSSICTHTHVHTHIHAHTYTAYICWAKENERGRWPSSFARSLNLKAHTPPWISPALKVIAQFPILWMLMRTPWEEDHNEDGMAKVFYQSPLLRSLRFCTLSTSGCLRGLVVTPSKSGPHVLWGPGDEADWAHGSAHPSAMSLKDGRGGAAFALWKVTASFPNYHIWGNRWESMWRNCGLLLKGGRCFLKKVATKRFYPVVPKALGIWRPR